VEYDGNLDAAFHLSKSAGKYALLPVSPSGSSVSWRVPWNLWKPILISHPSFPSPIRVDTHPLDARSQTFTHAHATYRWRFVSARELVLEKSADGIPKYIVAVFYLSVSNQFFPEGLRAWVGAVGKRGALATEGTLLLDERGVAAAVGVASLLVALKRERQRWWVLGGTV
jgi:hypothetical protein